MAALAAAALPLAVAPPATQALSAEELARRVEERLQQTRDLRARFVQSYRSGALGRETREHGTLSLKRPGRMRWEYEAPERKTFVSDGHSFYFYVPADRQVIVKDQKDATGVAGLLLAGTGAPLQRFVPSLEEAPAGRFRLRLVPREPDPDMDELRLEGDASFRLRAVEVLDAQGNRSRFEFDQLRENIGLKDALFRFEIPPGVEVIAG
jgi:outer membrane lipoprotein carrier protein